MSAPAVAFEKPLRIESRSALRRALQLCAPVVAREDLNADRGLPRKLTTHDYVKVMLATVREGHRHARWPKDVLESFLAADVVVGREQ